MRWEVFTFVNSMKDRTNSAIVYIKSFLISPREREGVRERASAYGSSSRECETSNPRVT